LQKVVGISDTNLKPPNVEKCFNMSSCVGQQQDCLAVSSFVDIQNSTGALLPFDTILCGKKVR